MSERGREVLAHGLLFLVHGRAHVKRISGGLNMRKIALFLAVPAVACFLSSGATAEPLTLEEFGIVHSEVTAEKAASKRARIVACLQTTREPLGCIGTTLRVCQVTLEACSYQEAAAWEQLGFDIYLELRRALGGPDWIDAAHLRLRAEIVTQCDAEAAVENERLMQRAIRAACYLRGAAGRTLDLRFALVAP